MQLRDFFLQMLLFLLGLVCSVFVPLLKPQSQKRIAMTLAGACFAVALMWTGYELGTRNQAVPSPIIVIATQAPAQAVDQAPTTAPLPPTVPQLPPTAVLAPTNQPPTDTPVPVTPTPKVNDVLYQADWSKGAGGWAGSPSWKVVNGMLVNDGSEYDAKDMAPFEPGKHDVNDYAVEAEMQFVRSTNGCSTNFGIGFRADNTGGYAAIIEVTNCSGSNNLVSIYGSGVDGPLQQKPFSAGTGWHLYRAEVKGNVIRLLIDGDPYLETTDNHFLTGGQVGLSSRTLEVNVRSFKVIKL